jgi:hypothetical protein
MKTHSADPASCFASAIADLFGETGFAVLDDENVEALADTLRTFLRETGIPTDEARGREHFERADTYYTETVEALQGS